MRVLAFLLSALSVQACSPSAHPPVPPIPSELVPAPPRSDTSLIWQPGHFDWTGAAYVWTPGQWVERAGHGTLWQDGYWRDRPVGPEWIRGHWE